MPLPLARLATLLVGVLMCASTAAAAPGSPDAAADAALRPLSRLDATGTAGDTAGVARPVAGVVPPAAEAGEPPMQAVTRATRPRRTLAPAPPIVSALIPYGTSRQAQMADYAARHYGIRTAVLRPQSVVLHFTESDSASGVISYFASNTPNLGELPGVCAHFVVGQDGTIYQLVSTDLMCRHAVGYNHRSIGIEVVQSSYGNPSVWADRQILNRPKQLQALLALVRWLQGQYGIATSDIQGHATINTAPGYLDLLGWRNDHTDWGLAAVLEFRRLLG